MKAAIVGFGKMGKAIRDVIISEGDEAVAIIDPYSCDSSVTSRVLDSSALVDADIVFDFSSPASIVDNIIMYSHIGIPAVIGTTGWYNELDRIKAICSDDDTKILYSGNFSLGVALFLKIARRAGELFNKVSGYDVAIREVHHNAKADSPSGTALMIANELIDTLDSKERILIGNSDGKISSDELQISSERVGREPGLHEVVFDSDADSIILEHHARSRSGFATGAVAAGKWLLGTDRKGFLAFDDFLDDLLGDI